MSLVSRYVIALGLAGVGFALIGCADPNAGKMEISGTAKIKGKPIKDGTVAFEPLDGQDTRATAVITDGAFAVDKSNGLKPGKYLIRVSAGDGKTAVNPVDENNPPGPGGGTNVISKDLVPRNWNIDSKQEVTVTKDGPNVFDWDIK